MPGGVSPNIISSLICNSVSDSCLFIIRLGLGLHRHNGLLAEFLAALQSRGLRQDFLHLFQLGLLLACQESLAELGLLLLQSGEGVSSVFQLVYFVHAGIVEVAVGDGVEI